VRSRKDIEREAERQAEFYTAHCATCGHGEFKHRADFRTYIETGHLPEVCSVEGCTCARFVEIEI
jgi:hypothetical protein